MRVLKKFTTAFLALSLIATLMLSLASCQTSLSGTYVMTSATDASSSALGTGANQSETKFVFDGDKVTKTQTFKYGETTMPLGEELTGTYDISYEGWNDGYKITIIWDDTSKKYAGKSEEERTEVFPFIKTASYIKIGSDFYYKQQTAESDHDHDHDHDH